MELDCTEFLRMAGRLFHRLTGDSMNVKEVHLFGDDKAVIITKREVNRFE